jgi:allantoinase
LSEAAAEQPRGRFGLRSTRVVLPDGIAPATVLVEGERIEAITSELVAGLPTLDFGDRVVAPGLVDCHVHVNEPGRVEWEGFATATRAAAAGGVTALVDMPLNSEPVTTSGAALEQKRAACAGQCWVDVGFWGGVVPGNLRELAGLAEQGALGCKAFLCDSGLETFPQASESDLRAALPILKDLGLPLLAHAELDLGGAHAETGTGYAAYLASRPPEWEEAAIRLLIDLCAATRCPVHVVHLSSARSLPLLREAKERGLPVSVETCPHYLCFEAEAIPPGATEYKCAPPIRDRENRERLWEGLLEGVIDFVITDHSPCVPALKLREQGDFMRAWGGIASLGLGLSAIWTEARRRGANVADLTRWMSARPAEFAGFGRRKGRVARGYDADFVVWEPEAAFRVEPEALFTKHRLTPYAGRELLGRVHQTWLRGQRVFDGVRHSARAAGTPLLYREGGA